MSCSSVKNRALMPSCSCPATSSRKHWPHGKNDRSILPRLNPLKSPCISLPMPALQQKTMASQKVAAYLKLAQENEGLWNAVLIFLGTLFLLGAIPFYPLYVVPLLALVCGAVGFRLPWAGTLLSMLLAFPAMAYQSAIFAWIFIFLLAVVIFEMIENWRIISTLQILIMAPFSFNALPFFGWITVLGMFVASLHFGSRKSLFISLPAVFLILLLSSIWLVDHSDFMPIPQPLS